VEPQVEIQEEMAVLDIYICQCITEQAAEEKACPLAVSVAVVLVVMVVILLAGALQVDTEMVEAAAPMVLAARDLQAL